MRKDGASLRPLKWDHREDKPAALFGQRDREIKCEGRRLALQNGLNARERFVRAIAVPGGRHSACLEKIDEPAAGTRKTLAMVTGELLPCPIDRQKMPLPIDNRGLHGKRIQGGAIEGLAFL